MKIRESLIRGSRETEFISRIKKLVFFCPYISSPTVKNGMYRALCFHDFIRPSYFCEIWALCVSRLEVNLKNLLGRKLTTDVIFIFLTSVNNDYYLYFYCYRYGLWNQICRNHWIYQFPYIRVWVTCTFKFNIKETFKI